MATGGDYERTCVTLLQGENELGLVEGANAAPTKIKKIVEFGERRRETSTGTRKTGSGRIRREVC